MDIVRKREWTQFGKAAGLALGLCFFIWLLQLVFLADPIDYLVPGVLFTAACYLAFGYEQNGVDRNLKILRMAVAFLVFSGSIWASLPDHKPVLVKWEPFSEAAFEKARLEKKPVLIDFTASWCGPCHELERKVFTKEEVAVEMKRFVLLQVDMSDQESAATAEFSERFRVEGYPTIAFFGTTGVENRELRVTGVVGPKDFLQRLKIVR